VRLQVVHEKWTFQRRTFQGYQGRVTILKHKPASQGKSTLIQIPIKFGTAFQT
jgi:hypothetical protein